MIRDWAKLHSIDAFFRDIKGIYYVLVGHLHYLNSVSPSALNWIHDHGHWYSCVHFYFIISILKEIRNLTDPWVQRKDDYTG